MHDALGPEARAEIAALAREYGAQLPTRVARLVELGRQACAGGERLEEAIREAHRLHGTAGSYGFAPVSEAAGRLEAALIEIRDRRGQPGKLSWDVVAGVVDALARTAWV